MLGQPVGDEGFSHVLGLQLEAVRAAQAGAMAASIMHASISAPVR